ncbi:hypothetical protein PQX77_015941 [Marasmius sp. AFHP31]|nr:hypothetical protein PQX77_015941 [Marasmius sp. AFHP31]
MQQKFLALLAFILPAVLAGPVAHLPVPGGRDNPTIGHPQNNPDCMGTYHQVMDFKEKRTDDYDSKNDYKPDCPAQKPGALGIVGLLRRGVEDSYGDKGKHDSGDYEHPQKHDYPPEGSHGDQRKKYYAQENKHDDEHNDKDKDNNEDDYYKEKHGEDNETGIISGVLGAIKGIVN